MPRPHTRGPTLALQTALSSPPGIRSTLSRNWSPSSSWSAAAKPWLARSRTIRWTPLSHGRSGLPWNRFLRGWALLESSARGAGSTARCAASRMANLAKPIPEPLHLPTGCNPRQKSASSAGREAMMYSVKRTAEWLSPRPIAISSLKWWQIGLRKGSLIAKAARSAWKSRPRPVALVVFE
jgi:hypothetical protein